MANYKYKSAGPPPIEKLMIPFYEWLARKIPEWISPNLITLTAFICGVTSFAVMLPYDLTLMAVVPSWCFLATSVLIMVFSTLDEIDGKHARNTKSSSALGQVLDHGLDTFSYPMLVLGICQAFHLSSVETSYLAIAGRLMLYS